MDLVDGARRVRSWETSVTSMLASAATENEAQVLTSLGVDILDLKDPSRGALGALQVQLVEEIVSRFPAQTISATVGDLPMDPVLIAQAVDEMAATGVKYVKVGFFAPEAEWPPVLAALEPLAMRGVAIIAVLFGDQPITLAMLSAFKRSAFHGVMIDTADKTKGSLLAQRDIQWLKAFVDTGRRLGLLTGLAGSLLLEDVPSLKALGPDYLGFRGALCLSGRTGSLDPGAVQSVRTAVLSIESVSGGV